MPIVYLGENADAENTSEPVRDEGARALLLKSDVGRGKFCEEAIARTLDTFRRLDVLG